MKFVIKKYLNFKLRHWDNTLKNPHEYQRAIFKNLINQGRKTIFGQDHDFDSIENYEDFCARVPVRSYEDFIPYVDQIKAGGMDVLYPGKPSYFSKSSGTTSNVKYIPLHDDYLKTYAHAGKDMIYNYLRETENFHVLKGKNLFLQGSPALEQFKNFKIGRMSGISYYIMPSFIKRKQLPSYNTNIMHDWEAKVRRIVEETKSADIQMLGGIPPWILMYFDYLSESHQKTLIKDIFPKLQLYIHGGVNIEPYREILRKKIGNDIHTLDTYTASEGFLGFQASIHDKAMTLCTDNEIFYEFMALDDYLKHKNKATRLRLEDVEMDVDYVIILNNCSGLWAYVIGDTMRFTNLEPYQFILTGRVSQFTSMFGEHLIESEVRNAIESAIERFHLQIRAYTIAPKISENKGSDSHHEWWIDFAEIPTNIEEVALHLDEVIQRQNHLYADLIQGKVIKPLRIIPLKAHAFENLYLKEKKMDGQNKIPSLANDRILVDKLSSYRMESSIME